MPYLVSSFLSVLPIPTACSQRPAPQEVSRAPIRLQRPPQMGPQPPSSEWRERGAEYSSLAAPSGSFF